jgi:hypothetical protein
VHTTPMGHVNVMGPWCVAQNPRWIAAASNFDAPRFFHTALLQRAEQCTPGTPVVARALEFALNVRILSRHHGNIKPPVVATTLKSQELWI